MIEYITSLDFAVLDFIRANLRTDFMDTLMVFLSHIGEGGIVWFLIAIPMLFFKKTRFCGVCIILSMGVALVLGEYVLKNLIGRVRPCNVNLSVEMLVRRPGSYSFPSGHTSSSFASATAIFLYNKKAGVFALILAALIAFSRLYNYVHYPSDVLAGMLFGIFVSVLVFFILKKYHFDNKLENLRFSKRS